MIIAYQYLPYTATYPETLFEEVMSLVFGFGHRLERSGFQRRFRELWIEQVIEEFIY